MKNQIPKNWQKVKLGKVVDITSSKRIFAHEYLKSGVPFYRGKEIIEKFNGNKVSTDLFISEDKYKDIEIKFGVPRSGDMLLTSVGTLGIPYLVNEDERFYFKDGNLTWFRKFKGIDNRFLYLWIQSSLGKAQLIKHIIGSSQQALTIDGLKKVEIELPPMNEQEKIASILSTFDDKIEMNNKIAKTLEEMAQAIFKEWFVKFKFPGHEKVEFVDGELGKIPSSWSIGVLNDYIGELESGKRPRGGVSSYKEGIPSIGAENISGLINSDYSNIKYIPTDFFETMNMGKIKDNDILIYKDGGVPGIFKVKFTIVGEGYPFSNAAINEHVFRLQANKPERQFYLYFWLNTHLSIRYFDSIGGKAAVPGINSTDLKNLPLLIPNEDIVVLFHRLACPLIKKILNINLQNQVLSKTRDLLLPKLMSGEVRV